MPDVSVATSEQRPAFAASQQRARFLLDHRQISLTLFQFAFFHDSSRGRYLPQHDPPLISHSCKPMHSILNRSLHSSWCYLPQLSNKQSRWYPFLSYVPDCSLAAYCLRPITLINVLTALALSIEMLDAWTTFNIWNWDRRSASFDDVSLTATQPWNCSSISLYLKSPRG